jgi:hypothetical protein
MILFSRTLVLDRPVFARIQAPRRAQRHPVLSRNVTHGPNNRNADYRGRDPDRPHPVARGMGRLVHGSTDPLREGRKQNALDRQSEAEGCDKIEHEAPVATGPEPGRGPPRAAVLEEVTRRAAVFGPTAAAAPLGAEGVSSRRWDRPDCSARPHC